MSIRPYGPAGVYTDGRELYTRNIVPGVAVYGEPLVREGVVEYRLWDPHRSKLAAFLRRGGSEFPFASSSRVLYLGAASGTTASHLSDICANGSVCAVELSRRVFDKLLRVAGQRPNLVPIMADAAKPESYRGIVGPPVDVVYQDVAQPEQDAIFLRNLEMLRDHGVGFLAVKARSVDVSARPAAVFEATRRALERAGCHVRDVRSLHPFQRDHAMVVVER